MNTHQTVTSDGLRVTSGQSRIVTLFCMLLLIFSSCTKEKETERSYPRVTTGLVTNINAGGATFNGSFLQTGNSEVIDHGFVYDVSGLPNIQSSEKISLGVSPGNGSFTATANFGMEKGKTYYVCAYAQNKDKVFYAEPVSFVSMGGPSPEILAIVPSEGLRGDTVIIRGKYFSQQPFRNTVNFGDSEASIVTCSDTVITARVPLTKGIEHVDVFVITAKQTAQKVTGFKYLKPVITNLSPKQGVIGDTITITGKYLRPDMEVKFNQTKAKVYKSDKVLAKIIVPACQSTQANISATIDGLTSTADLTFTYAKAEVTGISADKGVVGDTILIQGKNFGYQKDVVSVFVGEQPAKVVDVKNIFIKVIVPSSGKKDPQTVTVKVDGQLIDFSGTIEIISPWTRKNKFPGWVYSNAIAFTVTGSIYVLPGAAGSPVWQYVSNEDQWVRKGNYGYVRTDMARFEINGKYYFTNSDRQWLIYNPVDDSWTGKEVSSESATFLSAFVVNNVVYLIRSYWTEPRTYETWTYNPESNILTKINDISQVSGYNFSFATGNKVYTGFGRTIMEFTPETNVWKNIATISAEISNPKVFVIRNKAYFLSSNRDVWEYDIDSNQCHRVSYYPDQIPGTSFSFVIDNKIYICSDETEKIIYEFDPSKM